jgi:NADH-quinone oxidoreductase subunit K
MALGLHHFLILGTLLLGAGVTTMLTKRNAIGILIGVELVINAAAINFVAFNQYLWNQAIDGVMFAVFIVVLAAAEAAVALAIFLNYYNLLGSIDVEEGRELKG